MPFSRNVAGRLQAVCLVVGLAVVGAAAGHAAAAPRADEVFTDAEIGRAIETLRGDPNLVQAQKTKKSLRWKDSAAPAPPTRPADWVVSFFEWLTGGASVLVWTLGALAAALALLWVVRGVRLRLPAARRVQPPPPITHVQSLDVRPASLPPDIGAAADGLLAAGQIREALSLLYRGALSRVIHRHGIPLAASATEGDVLSRVSARLAPSGAQYLVRLIALWQRTVYAADPPAHEAVAALCRDFPVLDGAPV